MDTPDLTSTGIGSCRRTGLTGRQRLAGLMVAAGLLTHPLTRARGENQADYRFESYREDGGRMSVDTQSVLFDTQVKPWLTLKGQAVYDAISGATPSGAPPPAEVAAIAQLPVTGPLSTSVPTQFMHDRRWAGSLDAAFSFGPHHLTPQFSYSTEHDYISYGGALNYSLDLNQKNTTLNLGWSHDADSILANSATYIYQDQHKDTDDFLIGVNQLLSPRTVLTANFTYRNARGYLNDPYRGVMFDAYPQFDPNNPSLFGESRPARRQSYIGYVSLTQFITPLRGSAEGAYRFYHDTFGIDAHTVELAWHQKIGRRILLSPEFRYYRQSAASFYGTHFAGDPSDPTNPTPIPAYYSADYRLSRLETFTYGATASARISDRFSIDVSYHRYEMHGLDDVTSASAYPKANVFTIGGRVWF
jgi:hypothetical protein